MVSEADARTRAEALVRAFCGWRVAPSVTEVLTLDGDNAGALLLPTMHVTDLLSLTINGEVLDPTTYQWSPRGVVRVTGSVPVSWGTWGSLYYEPRLQTIEAQVTHGYDVWPPEVEAVLDALTSRGVQVPSQYVQVGQVRVATGSDGQPVGAALTAGDRDVLSRYQLPPRP